MARQNVGAQAGCCIPAFGYRPLPRRARTSRVLEVGSQWDGCTLSVQEIDIFWSFHNKRALLSAVVKGLNILKIEAREVLDRNAEGRNLEGGDDLSAERTMRPMSGQCSNLSTPNTKHLLTQTNSTQPHSLQATCSGSHCLPEFIPRISRPPPPPSQEHIPAFPQQPGHSIFFLHFTSTGTISFGLSSSLWMRSRKVNAASKSVRSFSVWSPVPHERVLTADSTNWWRPRFRSFSASSTRRGQCAIAIPRTAMLGHGRARPRGYGKSL